MEHPVPRQITTFEFRLIGPLTIKQFGYILVAGVFGYLVFLAVPVQILNAIFGVAVLGVGAVFAFVPVNDRPLEVFLGNLLRRLTLPTQYVFHKNNDAGNLFDGLYFVDDPHIVLTHIQTKAQLDSYLNSKSKTKSTPQDKGVLHMFSTPHVPPPPTPEQIKPLSNPSPTQETVSEKPFISGSVKNKRGIPLPGILVYIKDPQTTEVKRILKSNPHGIFASFHPIPKKQYAVDATDPANGYFFDSQLLTFDKDQNTLEIVSKELL